MIRKRQVGAALLTAMIIVTLISSLAAAMVWRQYRAVQIESAERARGQASWILLGALDWARLILRADAQANRQQAVDHLGEVWAVPLAEARLSTFLAAEKGQSAEDEGPEAFLSGTIQDAQAYYNLRNLANGEKLPAEELRTLQRICEIAGLSTDAALQFANKLRSAILPGDASNSPLIPKSLDQLAWLGLSPEQIAKLKPMLILLPKPTPVNLNTAPREVIAALYEGMDLGRAEKLVQARASKPLNSIDDAKAFFPGEAKLSAERVSVASSYFIVSGRLRLDERQLEERSLVFRNNLDMQVLARERVNLVLPPR